MPFWTILGTWWVFSVFTHCGRNGPQTSREVLLAVVESITKTVGGLSALLDHFGDMVGVFCFFVFKHWGRNGL